MKVAYITSKAEFSNNTSAVNRRRLFNLKKFWEADGIEVFPWSSDCSCDVIYVPNLLNALDKTNYAASIRRSGQALVLGIIEDFDCSRWASAAVEGINDLPTLVAAEAHRNRSLKGRLKVVRDRIADFGILNTTHTRTVKLLRSADAILCTSELQAAGLRKYNANVSGIADPINECEYNSHNSRFAASLLEQSRLRDQVVIVWEGTAWGLQLLEIVRPAINEAAALRPGRIRLRVIAPRHRPDPLFNEIDNERILAERFICDTERFDWTLETAGDLLRTADIGIAPMPSQNPFYRAKAYSKPLVYMTLGLPVVASSIPSYCELIEHGISGYTSNHLDDWVSFILRLHDDPALRRTIGRNAMERVMTFHSPQMAASHFGDVFRSAVAINCALR